VRSCGRRGGREYIQEFLRKLTGIIGGWAGSIEANADKYCSMIEDIHYLMAKLHSNGPFIGPSAVAKDVILIVSSYQERALHGIRAYKWHAKQALGPTLLNGALRPAEIQQSMGMAV
jgi:hypothetical protein